MKRDDLSREALLSELEAMPGELRKAFAGLAGAQLALPGPGGSFSPLEHVWHMADLEVEGFAVRIERLLSERDPRLADFDGDRLAEERNYRVLSLASGLERFEQARRANVARLRTIGERDWLNTGNQEGLGRVSLGDMPSLMHQHDAAHRLEIKAWHAHARPINE